MSERRNDADELNEAANDVILHGGPSVALPCVRPNVRPVIAIAVPKIVLVKAAYQLKGTRLAVRLGTDSGFTGTGTLSCNPGGQVRVFSTRDGLVPLAMPWNNIAGANLTRGVTVYVEGVSASAGMNGTVLSLALAGGNKNIVHSPATDTMTCVSVQLDLCQYKPLPGGPDPVPVADKIGVGRNLHLQTPDLWAGRALLIIRQALPADYPGNLVLKARNNKLRTYAYADEVAAANQVAQANPLIKANGLLVGNAGKFWVEGAFVSGAVLDTGFTLEISDWPNVEGDKANLTVVKAVIEIHNMPRQARGTQALIAAGGKMNPGRSLHLQDGGNHYGRAKVLIKRVEPSRWTGNLEVQVCDTLGNTANPRVSLFAAEAPGGAAFVNPLAHPADIPSAGKVIWAQGAIVSGAMRDTQLRLRVADAEGSADRVAITVHQFYVREITFNGIRDIYYARIPTAGSYILPPAADLPPPKHLTPMQVRPAATTPHWRRMAGQNAAAEFSWPAVYVRRGGSGSPNPTMKVKFELFPKPGDNITVKIKATVAASTMTAEEQDVTFNNGDSPDVTFAIKKLPNTVAYMNGVRFRWYFDGYGPETRHTLFTTDKRPRDADDLQGNEYIWEIFEWSCRWADGVKTKANVFAAIWAQFYHAAGVAASGLVYWKEWNNGIAPAQDLPTAVQSQDDWDPDQQNAASCIVFDRVLINSCSAHGIRATEITLAPQTATFQYAGVAHTCESWNDTTVNGQNNAASPPSWESHWIATVKLGRWAFYDASYGDGPTNSPTPGAANTAINVLNFEPRTVQDYNCTNTVTNTAVIRPRSGNPAVAPHLTGEVLWTNG